MTLPLTTHVLGYPRIGARRELKKATEAYWQGKISRAALDDTARALRRAHWLAQQKAGIGLIPSNDFSFYDQVLDLTCLVGNVPPRFGKIPGDVELDTRFAIARGVRRGRGEEACCGTCQNDTFASEMTKWFDTNYHYIVPEFSAETRFRLASTKPFDEFAEALALGIKTKPVFVGPVTYLSLGKVHDTAHPEFDPLALLDDLVAIYIQVLQRLAALGAEWVQLDEPIAATNLSPALRAALHRAYEKIVAAVPSLKILVACYFGGLRDNLTDFVRLPVRAVHIDAVRAPEELEAVLAALPAPTALSLGIIDGRNIWRTDLERALPLVRRALAALGPERLLLAPSCSLQHVPVSLREETKLDVDLRDWLAFAEEKLTEVVELRALALGGGGGVFLAENRRAWAARRTSPRIHRPGVQARLAAVSPDDFHRKSPFPVRQRQQRERLRLPLFPTTTIGSFPQTAEIRAIRARWRKGEITDDAYRIFLENATAACVRFQEEAGVDMLVHGEFERNDMVEYFGEQLAGYAFTRNGWVQSYGSRCVKPPVIYGDVSRPAPMTVAWSRYAQSLTAKPMKGMLSGPLTMLFWSFVRDDLPKREVALQLALALRDEVLDLEAAGIKLIQIDEPAIREGLPLKQADWPAYLDWAVQAFRITASGVRDETQIHTHMCYSEFKDILPAIAALDADVITIETSRARMKLLDAFADFKYPNDIGPGLYDIHSPRVPAQAEMRALLDRALAVVPAERLWVNPDCGLKTRGWPETEAALAKMVATARDARSALAADGMVLGNDAN